MAPADVPARTLAVVGGGFSGTLVAVHLLRLASGPLTVRLIERAPRVGPGLAYGPADDTHLLNVPAARMSALPDEPLHFLRWLAARAGEPVPEDAFVPRRVYGDYLADLLAEAAAQARPGLALEVVHGEVVAAEPADGHVRLRLADGRVFVARRAVLALGNFAPGLPDVPGLSALDADRFARDPWAPGALDGLAPDTPLLAVGTGLTLVDLALSLAARGHTGPLHAVSRHGLLPQPHLPGLSDPSVFSPMTSKASALVGEVRRRAQDAGPGWRGVVDGLRTNQQALWQALPEAERRRFLRHGRAYWEVHRHRMAPEAAEAIAAMRASGRLVIHAGRLIEAAADGDGVRLTVRPRGGHTAIDLYGRRLFNCTGPQTDPRRVDSALLASLLAQGLARPDPLGLGLDTLFNGALLNAAGMPSRTLFTLGPLRKGALWETTAVPEIRRQAAMLARELLGA